MKKVRTIFSFAPIFRLFLKLSFRHTFTFVYRSHNSLGLRRFLGMFCIAAFISIQNQNLSEFPSSEVRIFGRITDSFYQICVWNPIGADYLHNEVELQWGVQSQIITKRNFLKPPWYSFSTAFFWLGFRFRFPSSLLPFPQRLVRIELFHEFQE